MKKIISLIWCLTLTLSICAQPAREKDDTVVVLLEVNHRAAPKVIQKTDAVLARFIESMKQEHLINGSEYYVRIYRRTQKRIFSFHLTGPQAAKRSELEAFIIQDRDELYFGDTMP